MLCAWPLSQSQACEAVNCVKIVEPRYNVGGAQSRVCNYAELQACNTLCCLRMAACPRLESTGARALLPTGCHDAMLMDIPQKAEQDGSAARGSRTGASPDGRDLAS